MLWTPNPKTLEPVHLCPVCGGIDRKHHASKNNRDMKRYLSLHRICCCGGGQSTTCTTTDPDLIGLDFTVTFTGVGLDCTGCLSGPQFTYKIKTLDINGAWDLPLTVSDPFWGAFSSTGNININLGTLDTYEITPTCTTLIESTNLGLFTVDAAFECLGGVINVTEISAHINNKFSDTSTPEIFSFRWTSIRKGGSNDNPVTLGTSVSNELSCGSTIDVASQTGTAVVNFT